MTNVLTILGWTMPLCIAAAGFAQQPEDAPADLRVLSFNIRYGTANDGPDAWPHRKGMVAGVIDRSEADFVGTQESLKFQLDDLRDQLPGYAMIGVGRDDGKTRGEYAAILYKADRWSVDAHEHGTFWLSDTPGAPGSTSWGNHTTRIVTWARFVHRDTGRGVYLYNTHYDHQSQPARINSSRLLADRIAGRGHPDDPVIVTGDFNAGEDNPAIAYLKGRASGALDPPVTLRDSFRIAHSDAEQVGTFNGFKGAADGRKIDYIFISPGVEVLGARIIRTQFNGRYPSDHFPIDAHLRLPTR